MVADSFITELEKRDEIAEKLKRLAEHENRTMSQQINFLVDKRCEELGIVIEGKE